MGGSTNSVLHLIAMGHAADVPITLNDFQEISNRTPYIADLRPSGKYLMADFTIDWWNTCCSEVSPIERTYSRRYPHSDWQDDGRKSG